MQIGFIGLGAMGKYMALNVVKAGHKVVVFDIVRQPVDELVAAGAATAISPSEAAKGCAVIITMLPNSPHVEEVVCGAGGVLETAARGRSWLTCPPLLRLLCKKLGRQLPKRASR